MPENFDTKKQESIKPDYLVYKTNPLLMVRDEMALMQARFFTAYLCKVDPQNPDTYTARFSLEAFCEMLSVDTSNIKKLKADCSKIRSMGFDFVEYRRKHGEKIDPMLMDEVSLFSRFTISGNYDDGYFVEVTPTEEMKHLLLHQRQYGFVSYEAKNTLILSKKRNMRMYEFLKRSEGKGITVDLSTLKAYLGLQAEDYPKMRDFKRDVLDKGIKEINKKTDIFVECEPKRKGRGGKIVGFHFNITKNTIATVEAQKNRKDKKPLRLSDEEINDFNNDSSAIDAQKAAPVPQGDIPARDSLADDATRGSFYPGNLESQMDIDDFFGEEEAEIFTDFSKNPLEMTFKNDIDRQNYIDQYIALNIKDKFCRDELVYSVPEDVHQYVEDNLMAIKTYAFNYIKMSDDFAMLHVDRLHKHQGDVVRAVETYTKTKWLPRHRHNTKNDVTSHYISCFSYWLMDNYGADQ